MIDDDVFFAGRMLHVLEDRLYRETDLHLSVLNFIALLCTEEVKFKVKVQGRSDLDFPYISDCLDSTGVYSSTATFFIYLFNTRRILSEVISIGR